MILGIVVAFFGGYASIAWLLRFVAHHRITTFLWYRVALGLVLFVVLGAGWLSAT
jgi:undecaprenyl-diphosphatase